MKHKILPKIEIEFRSIINRPQYRKIEAFLQKNAKDLGKDNKDVYFFIMPEKLLKVVNNISQRNAEVVLKLGKIGKGSDFEELRIPIKQADINDAVKIFSYLTVAKNIMHSFQKRHNYRYKDVEIALKYSDVWDYHIELEINVNNKNKKEAAEKKIKEVANELGIKLMNDKELSEFTRKKEEENSKANKNKINI